MSSPSTQPTSDLACTVIEEVHNDSLLDADDMACIISQSMSTILDSGTTSTLITGYIFQLRVADLMIRGKTHHLCLTNCLHAPGAMINLLSVSYMVEKGWVVSFLSAAAHCQLTFWGTPIGEIPMTGKLVFLDLWFVCPEDASPSLPQELSVFAHVPITWDLWHACMGHPGGDAVKQLPLIAKDVTVTHTMPLQHFITPHGKLHFIIFLNDHTNSLNI
ncbi:uncharacterized protein HD556DRAFT_1444287 [Suillus plorans]|uniref:Uncharacterized protein n=1 Tax=Suillus plorans TaxID=116603 RepID=A0A9P7DH36_9AGAM|nr:uncharacterized protein HD556DRAFT_1444287 [Suillus plorans]KAG1792607.1 hypothetical protein HD556DRAFT_1444287 [Suillus plorans]